MIFNVDIVWVQALAHAKKFHSICTQTAHTPIFVNFDENGRNFWEKNTPKMCLLTYWHPILGAEAPTHTPKHIQVSCSNDNLPKRYSMWKKCNRNRNHLFQMHEYLK